MSNKIKVHDLKVCFECPSCHSIKNEKLRPITMKATRLHGFVVCSNCKIKSEVIVIVKEYD